ncbi:MAG: ABC transporter ATP-binding protein [Firmicutes bacterium]|nr:ABC transporter ATP-binding protein [Bacillota bacterium]
MEDLTLQVKGLKTCFFTDKGVVPAVDGISFNVRRGKTLGIVGESGSGKSVTSLSIMRLLHEPSGRITEGEIIFDGKDLTKLTQQEMCKIRGKRISMIFQEPMTALNPVRTVGSQIAEIYNIHENLNKKEAQERSIEMLRMVGIPSPEQRFNEYPHQMSGGMRQRVMIAMALACNPELLIADEPTTALDVTIQAQILDLMLDLKNKLGTSIMLITHDLGVVSDIADDVIVMYAGSIMEYGTRDAVFQDMKHPYSIGLMESIPKIDSKERLTTIEGMVPSIFEMPQGCKFEPRCAFARPICKQCRPDLYDTGKGHFVSCFQYSEEHRGEWDGEA